MHNLYIQTREFSKLLNHQDLQCKGYIFETKFTDLTLEVIKSLNEFSNVIANKTLYIKDTFIFHTGDLNKVYSSIKSLNTNIKLIVGDPAFLYHFKQIDRDIVYGPDMIITSSKNGNFWIDNNAKTVELGKELTFAEINEICKNLQQTPFLQIFGNVSMFQSRRQLLSNFENHLNKTNKFKENDDLYLYDYERNLSYKILESDRGTEVFNGEIISIIDRIESFLYPMNLILNIDNKFSENINKQIILLHINVLTNKYEKNKLASIKKEVELLLDEPISRGFFYKETVY